MFVMLVGCLLLGFQLYSVVHVNAQDVPETCEYNFMSPKMRQAVLDAHNKRRSLLASGHVRRNVLSPDLFLTATNMLFMMYDCDLEMKAAYTDPCKTYAHTKTFNYTGMNFYHIKTKIQNFQPVKTPERALREAAEIWWEDHMYYTGFQGVTPQKKDYTIIPFLIMAKAETPKLGCAVHLCRYDNNIFTTQKYYGVLCYYEKPHVKVGIPIYKEGPACKGCPAGYKCDDRTKLCKDEKLYFPRYPPNPPKT